MTRKDQKLIDKFPDKTHEELLLLGLSDAGFIELQEELAKYRLVNNRSKQLLENRNKHATA